jgi:16S rRNA (guanine527-N7)-methyltransferase
MTEDEARTCLSEQHNVPRETLERMDAFVAFIRQGATEQNLIASSTLDHIWSRHILDSAQLNSFAPADGDWIDLGSGAGFPGLIIAAISGRGVTLVESRRKRVEFLQQAVALMGLQKQVRVAGVRAELLPECTFAVISARAFAPLAKLFSIGARFARPDTIWLLPKGRSASAELATVRGTWQGVFRVEQSITDPDSSILVAEQVRPRKQR